MDKVLLRVLADVVLPHTEGGVTFAYSKEQPVERSKAEVLVGKYKPPLYAIVDPSVPVVEPVAPPPPPVKPSVLESVPGITLDDESSYRTMVEPPSEEMVVPAVVVPAELKKGRGKRG